MKNLCRSVSRKASVRSQGRAGRPNLSALTERTSSTSTSGWTRTMTMKMIMTFVKLS